MHCRTFVSVSVLEARNAARKHLVSRNAIQHIQRLRRNAHVLMHVSPRSPRAALIKRMQEYSIRVDRHRAVWHIFQAQHFGDFEAGNVVANMVCGAAAATAVVIRTRAH